MGWLKKYQKGGKKLQSGVVVDKNTNMAKIYQNFMPVDSFPVITGQNSASDLPNIYGMAKEEKNPMRAHHTTPAGTYFMKPLEPNRNFYGYKGFWLENPNLVKDIAVHQTYPGEYAQRNPTYYSSNPRDRDMSWGCVNCRRPDIDKLFKYFPQGDTLNVLPRQGVAPKEAYVYGNPGPSGLYVDEESNYKHGGWLKEYQQGGKKDKALSIEGRVNKWLNDPQGKARKDAENKSGDGDEEIDNIRHASAGRYVTEAIANKTGNIPYVSKPLGVIGANIMGLGHEIGTYVTDPRWTDKNWKVSNFDKAKVISRELLEDAYNNFAGSVIGATDMTPEQKTARIKYLSQNYMIPDGYGLLHPYGDNPTFVDPYSKKKYGGYSTTGYKANSPDKDNPYNIIPSGRITMQNVPHPVLGIDNLGNRQMMMPGGEYQFQGNEVFEMPVMKEGGTVPTINDAGNFKNGVWVPDLATIKQQAKKLGSRTVKTKSGSIINFDENWNIKGVDDAPTMQGGGVPPFITSDIDEYNYRKARQLDSNYLNKNLRSYFNKNAQKFHNEHTVPWDPYASKLNPFGPKTYPKEEVDKMRHAYNIAREKNKDELLKNISRNLQIKNINKFIDVDNYINSHAYKQYYPQEDFIQDERAIGHLSVPQKNPYSGIWSNAYFSHPYQIAEDFPAATQEVIFDSKAPKSTGNKKAVKKLVPTVPTEKVSVSQIPVADMQQFPILQSAQQYANYAQVPASPYSVNVHKWDPMLSGRADEVKDFMTQEQLEAWKKANRAHALGTGRYETGIPPEYTTDGTISFSPQMKEGGIPERYKNMGFTRVGQKKAGDGQHKWKVLAKKGDSYKVVQGGYRGMQDFKQHHSEERRDRFWDRMGGKNSSKAKDPFSPLYWHKRFGTWEYGGSVEMEGGGIPPYITHDPNDPRIQARADSAEVYNSYLKSVNALTKEGYQPERYHNTLWKKDPRAGQVVDLPSNDYEEWFSHLKNKRFVHNLPKGKYEIQDMAADMVNTRLPYQVFNPKIKPKGVQMWTDNDVYVATPDHMYIERLGARITPLKQDIRPIYNYENAKPKQDVIYQPVINSKQVAIPPAKKINKTVLPINPIQPTQPVDIIKVPEAKKRYQFIREDSYGIKQSPVMDTAIEPEWFDPKSTSKYTQEMKQGGMIKRADGSYSQRGLWDNIRANAGSGKKPTKEMLQQEKKIRAAEKKEYGGWLSKYK